MSVCKHGIAFSECPDCSRDGSDSLHELVSFYESVGFTAEHHFKGEYVYMIDGIFNTVRVYEDGRVWEKNHITGKTIKKEANRDISGKNSTYTRR